MSAAVKTGLKGKNVVKLSYYQIFRYATRSEIAALMAGVMFGALSAVGAVHNMLQVGEISNAFVERTNPRGKSTSYMPLTSLFGGGRILNNASNEDNMKALQEDATAMTIGISVSILLSLVYGVISAGLINWSALRQITRIRILFLKSALRQDMAWYDTDKDFNVASSMSENLVIVKEGMGERLVLAANITGTALFAICSCIPLGWELTLACFASMPISFATALFVSNRNAAFTAQEMDSNSRAGRQAEFVLQAVRTVIGFGGENKEIEKYKQLLAPADQLGCRRGLYTGIGNGFNWLLTYSLNAIGLVYGTRLVLLDFDKPNDERTYNVGVVISILFSAYMAVQELILCVPHIESFASARDAAASVFHLIEMNPKVDNPQGGGREPPRTFGDIILEDVHFSYPSRPDVKVLNGLSLHVKAGENVALVGSSGCGKSTVLQLIQRLYDPWSGVVKLDGEDLKSYNLGWLRSSLGVVGQEPVLFYGTVHENIAICRPEATREEVRRVAKMAYAHDFIMGLQKGYETIIGERGASLSGGQKQRIAIARSLLREPAVLLLDEATSALDPHSERQVQAALDKASVGRTTITVSHRLSSIVNADRIICMDQGVVVEQGTPAELMELQGVYYKLVTSGIEVKPSEFESGALPGGGEGDGAAAMPSRPDLQSVPSKSRLNAPTKKSELNKESQDWMSPCGSVTSEESIGLETFTSNADEEPESQIHEDEILKPASALELLKLNRPEWGLVTAGCIAAFVQGACFPAYALIFGYSSGIFSLSSKEEIQYLANVYAWLFIAVSSIAGVALAIQIYAFTSANVKMTARLRYQYFSALLQQEVSYFTNNANTVGTICAKLNSDTAGIEGATGPRIGLVLHGIGSVVIGILVSFAYDWKLTLVTTAFIPFMIGSIWMDSILSEKSIADERAAMEKATSIATEAVTSVKTIQSLNVEEVFIKKFEDALAVACVAVERKTRWRGLVLGLGIYIPYMAYCSATVYGAMLVSYGEIEYKAVLLVTEAIAYGACMLGQNLVTAPSYSTAKACGTRVISMINRLPKVNTADKVRDKQDWVASGSVSVNDVEFGYSSKENKRILKGLSLLVEAGTTVALVGASGSGKSTVLQLLQRFYDPDSGNIKMDERDIRTSLALPQLRRQLGVVQQEPVLFDRTLAENIAYGDCSRKVSMHEIIAAAKSANIHNFIISLPQGYDTNLGASGAQLSGGQKQRVCIARALIRSPRLLLLDEATSALDASSERIVSAALASAAEGRTCITVAHRLSTIQNADVICVMDQGKIVEKGSHAELLAMKGHYWKMCRRQ